MVDVTRLPSLTRPFQRYLIKLGETVAVETSADNNPAHSECAFTLYLETNARTLHKKALLWNAVLNTTAFNA